MIRDCGFRIWDLFSELPFALSVYAYMNGAIFKLFGVAILLFDLLLAVIFALSINRLAPRSSDFVEGLVLFLSYVLLSTLIAVGLIHLHRWAAISASAVGFVWSLVLAGALGNQPLISLLFGAPIVFGMLLPLYATVRSWSILKPVGEFGLRPFYHALRSLDPLHLE